MSSLGVPFSNARYHLRQLASSPATWACVSLVLGIQCVVTAVGGENREPAWSWFTTLGLTREGVLSGEIWQLVSYGLLHGGWWHLAINALFLLLIGSRIEHMVGRPALVKAIAWGVLGGGAGHLLLAPGGVGAPLLVGLSGGCVSLLLLLVTLSPQSRMMPLPVSGRSLGLGILAAELILALMDPASGVPGMSRLGSGLEAIGMAGLFQMGHACHFGGGVAGWLFGRWLLRPRVSLASLRLDRERREAVDVRRAK
jgi:membrane associated rhomboid family serine protease